MAGVVGSIVELGATAGVGTAVALAPFFANGTSPLPIGGGENDSGKWTGMYYDHRNGTLAGHQQFLYDYASNLNIDDYVFSKKELDGRRGRVMLRKKGLALMRAIQQLDPNKPPTPDRVSRILKWRGLGKRYMHAIGMKEGYDSQQQKVQNSRFTFRPNVKKPSAKWHSKAMQGALSVIDLFVNIVLAYIPTKTYEQQMKELKQLRDSNLDALKGARINTADQWVPPKYAIAFDKIPECSPDLPASRVVEGATEADIDRAVAECLTSDCVGFALVREGRTYRQDQGLQPKEGRWFTVVDNPGTTKLKFFSSSDFAAIDPTRMTGAEINEKLCPIAYLKDQSRIEDRNGTDMGFTQTWLINSETQGSYLAAIAALVPDFWVRVEEMAAKLQEAMPDLTKEEAQMAAVMIAQGQGGAVGSSAGGAGAGGDLSGGLGDLDPRKLTAKDLKGLDADTVLALLWDGYVSPMMVWESLSMEGLKWNSTNRIEWWLIFAVVVVCVLVFFGAAEDEIEAAESIVRPSILCTPGGCIGNTMARALPGLGARA